MPKIHHLNCGTMCPVARRLVNGDGGLLGIGEMICHCLLIETERDGLILVDSGYGTDDLAHQERFEAAFRHLVRPTFRAAETAVAQVRALGFAPEDVQNIVLTHLDLDHAGGISDFPKAKVHVHEVEYRAAMARATLLERHRYFPAHWAHQPSWVLHSDQGDHWFGLRGLKLLPEIGVDVALVPLFGHTRGHSGVAVRAGLSGSRAGEAGPTRADGGPSPTGDWLLHGGDSYFYHGQLEQPPRCPLALTLFQKIVEVDARARRENTERLRDLHRRHPGEVQIFSAHDPIELARMRGH